MGVIIERFITIKDCVVLALNDIGASHMWNEAQFPQINELHEVLGPVRPAAVALGRRDANILTKVRIQERRTIELATLLLYLQNPQNIATKKSTAFPLTSRLDIIKLAGIISCLKTDSDDEFIEDGEITNQDKDHSLEVAMEKSIHQIIHLEESEENI
ncbi:hypothetical protein CBL_12825 [Carabus blaptoides fortunei]